MNLLIFGAPGSGKGTQSALLVDKKGYKQISSGDLFRNAIKAQTPLGLEAKSFIDAGNLVPDILTINLIKEVLEKNQDKKFILDGFPRNIKQAEALNDLLKGLNRTVGVALFLEVSQDNLKSRLIGRRVCKNCGATYHVDSFPTKVAGKCDNCGGEVVQRPDDKEDVIAKRLDVYEVNTAPLKDFYKRMGLFKSIDGLGSQEEIYKRIIQELEK
ncbi:MAG: adenylate kinase [Bdellovibrionota bacterium]